MRRERTKSHAGFEARGICALAGEPNVVRRYTQHTIIGRQQ
jgi:hypothetical protein